MSKKKNIIYNNRQVKTSMYLNNVIENDYFMALRQVCISIFEWENLPASMDQRKLELDLFNKGAAAGLYDKNSGVINTGVSAAGSLNIYGYPSALNCYSYGYNEFRNLYTGLIKDENGNVLNDKEKQAVYIMNNFDHLPTISMVEEYARRLAEAQRTIDVNVAAQRTPILIQCNENELLTLKNVYAQYLGNEPVIFADKNNSVDMSSLKAIKTDAPYIVDKLVQYKKELWNEFLTRIGVNNIQTEKRERLITDEANQNNELINLNLQAFFKTRKLAAKQLNELFDLDIKVKVSSDLFNIIKQTESAIGVSKTEESEVESNE